VLAASSLRRVKIIDNWSMETARNKLTALISSLCYILVFGTGVYSSDLGILKLIM
jgi:hypothetical protein